MTVDAALRVAARHGLPAPRATVRVETHEHDELMARAAHHRLTGLLVQAVADGAIEVTAEGAERITERAVRDATTSLLAEREMLTAHELLARRGVEHVFLKGATFAHTYYDHAALRPFVDVDILISGRVLDTVVQMFEAEGASRRFHELKPGFSARFGKAVTLCGSAGVELDLHRSFAPGPFGLAGDPTALLDRRSTFRLAGRDVPALDDTAAFLHACVHAATTRPRRLGHLRDVRQIAPRVEPGAVRALAGEHSLAACVEAAVQFATLEIGWTANLEEWRAAFADVPERERRWVSWYQGGRRSYASDAIGGALAIRRWRDRARYLAALAFRDEAGGDATRNHLRRWTNDVRRAARGIRSRAARP